MSGFQGVVVGYVNIGDNNRIVRFQTEGGTRSVVVRRARGGRGNVAALLELGNELMVTLRPQKGSLPVFAEADLVRAPTYARKSLEGVALLTYSCELVSALSPDGSDCTKQSKLLRVALEVLESPQSRCWPFRIALEGKGLTFAGLMPSLMMCVQCQRQAADSMRFSHELGGVLHEECGAGIVVSAAELAQMEALRRTPLMEASGVDFKTPANRWLLSDFAEYHLGNRLKSRGMFELLGD